MKKCLLTPPMQNAECRVHICVRIVHVFLNLTHTNYVERVAAYDPFVILSGFWLSKHALHIHIQIHNMGDHVLIGHLFFFLILITRHITSY